MTNTMSTDTPSEADGTDGKSNDERTFDEVTLTGEHARQFEYLMEMTPQDEDGTPLTEDEFAERLLANAVWSNYKQAIEAQTRQR